MVVILSKKVLYSTVSRKQCSTSSILYGKAGSGLAASGLHRSGPLNLCTRPCAPRNRRQHARGACCVLLPGHWGCEGLFTAPPLRATGTARVRWRAIPPREGGPLRNLSPRGVGALPARLCHRGLASGVPEPAQGGAGGVQTSSTTCLCVTAGAWGAPECHVQGRGLPPLAPLPQGTPSEASARSTKRRLAHSSTLD